MKKLIALIISIAMIASLTITSFAYSGATVNGSGIQENTDYTMVDYSTINVLKDFSCTSIECSDRVLTINLNGHTLTINNPSGNGIYANNNVSINGSGTLNITSGGSGDDGIGIRIISNKNLTIDNCNLIINAGDYGIYSANFYISTNSYVKIKSVSNDPIIITYGKSFDTPNVKIGDADLTDTDITNGYITQVLSEIKVKATSATANGGYISIGTALQNPDPVEEESTEENDPEVELDLGNGPVTVKTSNNSVVFNNTKVFEVSIGDGDVFVPIDLSSTPVKLDGIFLNNEVYKYIDDSGKDIEIINRFARAEVYTNKEIGLNPLSLHLSDVSEVAGTCATAIQKKAMNTSKVYAEVNYSFVSNGQAVEDDAKIYVPVDGEAKVFFIINENTLGSIPCETRNGYCVFNRYMDGTYVICAK